MIVSHVLDIPTHIVAVDAALLKNNLETIGVVQYKPSVYRATQVTRHKDGEADENEIVTLNQKSKGRLSDGTAEYRDLFLNMLCEF